MEDVTSKPECVICYMETNADIGTVHTPCGHIYCAICFALHMKIESRCAVCRREVTRIVKTIDTSIDLDPVPIRGCFSFIHRLFLRRERV